jgi:hypothetical protein
MAAAFPEDPALQRQVELVSAIGTPPAGRPYPHSSECARRDRDPEWTLDEAGWRRGPCDGHSTCTIREWWQGPSAPPPPRPGPVELDAWHHEYDGKRCPSIEPVIEVELSILDGDQWPHWRAMCRVCKAVQRWRAEAIEHYASYGVRISTRRPLVSGTLRDLVGDG